MRGGTSALLAVFVWYNVEVYLLCVLFFLCTHLPACHPTYWIWWEPRFNVNCGVEGCPRTYTSYRSFRRHLLEKHQEVIENEPHTTVEVYQEQTDNTLTDQAWISPNSKALLLLKMKEDRRISQNCLDGLIADITVLLRDEILSLKNDVMSCIRKGRDLDSIGNVDQLFAQTLAASPFQGLETAYLQRKYFVDHFQLVVRQSPLPLPLSQSSISPSLFLSPSFSLPLLSSVHYFICITCI